MSDLVFISKKGNRVTTSGLVAWKFEKRHADVLRALRNLECSDEFRQRNFALMVEDRELPQGGSSKNEYYLMTESGFSFLAMGFTGPKAAKFKEDYINAFEQLRKKESKPALPDFENPVEMARAWADQMEQRQLAEAKIKSLEPKASYAERVLEKDGQLVDVGQAAKLLKLPFGRNTLFKRLREEGVFFKSRNEPLQQYLNYFELRKKEVMMGTEMRMVTKVYVNAKGLYWLSKRYDGSLEEFENLKIE